MHYPILGAAGAELKTLHPVAALMTRVMRMIRKAFKLDIPPTSPTLVLGARASGTGPESPNPRVGGPDESRSVNTRARMTAWPD